MKQNNNIYEKYEAILNAIKTITKADDCSIFLLDSELGMDEEEKKEVFGQQNERIAEANKDLETYYTAHLSNITSEDIDQYSILTFFVGTGEFWDLESYKMRPHKYIVFNPPTSVNGIDEIDNNLFISREGLTAYTARVGKAIVVDNRHDVEKHPSFSGLNEGDTLVHDYCAKSGLFEHLIRFCPNGFFFNNLLAV